MLDSGIIEYEVIRPSNEQSLHMKTILLIQKQRGFLNFDVTRRVVRKRNQYCHKLMFFQLCLWLATRVPHQNSNNLKGVFGIKLCFKVFVISVMQHRDVCELGRIEKYQPLYGKCILGTSTHSHVMWLRECGPNNMIALHVHKHKGLAHYVEGSV